METTFISIHDLSLDARLLYVSTSIVDILGYLPQDVIGRSCWEYFHPDEIPFAREIHGRGVQLDKAAVLNYCQIKNRDGRWVGCECVFTVVHDVLVASTSIYRRGSKSQKRAEDAPIIRQLFSSSPRDPRYHMLSYISHRFSQELRPQSHEPRAALFLNRFTRTLTIMYATNGLAGILGLSADELNGKSFYYCIQENCLPEAVRCLESAKANDSIAYLRFWYRDPRQDERRDHDELIAESHSSGDDEDGGVHLTDRMDEDSNERDRHSDYSTPRSRSSMSYEPSHTPNRDSMDRNSRSSSGHSTDRNGHGNNRIFDRGAHSQSSSSSISASDVGQQSFGRSQSPMQSRTELEAVVSCTSDGLVVILRRARSIVPPAAQPLAEPVEHPYANGFFASPWATNPILPDPHYRPNHPQPPSIMSNRIPPNPTAAEANMAAAHGPASQDFMRSIRDVAVFAWALTGINGSLAQYGRGKSTGESLPPGGLPIWEPDANAGPESEPYIGYDDGLEWKDTNGYQNRDHRYASDGHGNGNGNGNGNGIGNGNRNGMINGHGNNGHHLRKSYDFPGILMEANAGGGGGGGNGADAARGGTRWMYGASPEAKPWDRIYSKRNPAL